METKKIKVLFNNIKDNSNSQATPASHDIGEYIVPTEVADHLIDREVADIVAENKKLSLKFKKKVSKKK